MANTKDKFAPFFLFINTCSWRVLSIPHLSPVSTDKCTWIWLFNLLSVKFLPLGKSCTALLDDDKVVPLCGFPAGALGSVYHLKKVAELLKRPKKRKFF